MREFKVGDDVFNILTMEWERIIDVDLEAVYAVQTRESAYTAEGLFFDDHINPVIYHEAPDWCVNAPPKPCEFVKGQRVLISGAVKRYFSHVGKNGMYHCFNSGADEWSACGYTTGWGKDQVLAADKE